MGGYFVLPRGWMDDPIFGSEPFSRREAWLWLIEEASFQPETLGQVRHSIRFMAKAWGWHRSSVSRFVHTLIRARHIRDTTETATETATSILTICNYEQFSPRSAAGRDGTRTEAEQQPRQTINKKKISYIDISKEISPSRPTLRVVDPKFEEFWLECPKRVGKVSAEKSYAQALRQVSHAELVSAMRIYAAARNGQDPRFTVHPATWLNQGRWADETSGSNHGHAQPAGPKPSLQEILGDDYERAMGLAH